MKTISKWIDVGVKWVFLSSADPTKASSTVKFALLGVVPFIIKIAAVSCGLGLACVAFLNQQWLESAIAIIANIVYFLTGLIAVIGTAWAFIRKVGNTVQGTNVAV